MKKQDNVSLVDVRTVIRSKSPVLERYLPNFVIRYLENILHQNEINDILNNFGHLPGAQAADAIYRYSDAQIVVHGIDKVPVEGRYIFVSNHPLGGLDGVMLIKVIGERFQGVKFIVNDLLLHLKIFKDVFVPVNKHGYQNPHYAQQINETYESNDQIIYFPAGLCSRRIKGVITDLPWKRSVFRKAAQYHRDIIPIFFSGQNSRFFYRLANIRKFLHIPFNLEMLYLSDEAFRQKGATFDIYFGSPIPYNSFSSLKSLDQWILSIRNYVYSLPQQK